MKRTKRVVSMMMAATMMAGTLAGCGSSEQAAATGDSTVVQETKDAQETKIDDAVTPTAEKADGEVTELTFWYSWTDKIQENNIALTEEFNETVGKELGIHVTAEYQGTYDDLHQKLQAAYVAGETPDVSVMEIGSIRTFAENGVIEPLDTYINAAGVDMSDFHDGLMQNSYIEGACYGIPYLRSTPIMYMNKNLIEEAGLAADGLKTWDDLKNYATTVHEETGKYGISIWSYYWAFEAFMLEHGSSVLNAEETATNLNSDAAKEIIHFFKDLKESGAAHLYPAVDSDKVKTDVMNLNTAIWYGSTGDFTYYNQVAADCGFELVCNFFPMDECYGVTSGGCNITMISNIPEENKQAAWTFIEWMTAKEQTIKACKNTGYLASRKSAADSEEMNALYAEIPQYRVALDQLAYGTGRPMNPGYVEATKELDSALDAMWVNDIDVDTTLAELEAKINKLLNE